MLDVAGDLVFNSSKITKKSVGIDFANEMIKIANKKYKKEFILRN